MLTYQTFCSIGSEPITDPRVITCSPLCKKQKQKAEHRPHPIKTQQMDHKQNERERLSMKARIRMVAGVTLNKKRYQTTNIKLIKTGNIKKNGGRTKQRFPKKWPLPWPPKNHHNSEAKKVLTTVFSTCIHSNI